MSELNFAIKRLINFQDSAEGSNLPPPQRGEFRLPIVSGLKTLKTENFLGGTLVTLGWVEPEDFRRPAFYNIYAKNPFDENRNAILVGSAERAPGRVRVMTNSEDPQPVVLFVQSVTSTGLFNPIEFSPSTTAIVRTAKIEESDVVAGLLTGHDIQSAVFQSVNLYGAIGAIPPNPEQVTTLVDENDEGVLMHLGFTYTSADPSLQARAEFRVQIDGGIVAVYPVIFGDTVTINIPVAAAAECSNVTAPPIGGAAVGDTWSHQLNITYKTSLLVQFVLTTASNAAAGSPGAGTVRVRRALKN